jgi:hypothetical protein
MRGSQALLIAVGAVASVENVDGAEAGAPEALRAPGAFHFALDGEIHLMNGLRDPGRLPGRSGRRQ